MNKIVDNNDILKLSIFDNSQILDVVPVVSFHAVAAMEKAINEFFVLIQVVDDNRCVVFCASCKYINVVQFGHFLEKLETVGTNIEIETDSFVLDLYLAIIELGTA